MASEQYSGFNLNQDKATATAVYTEYIRELATLYWFKLNSLYKRYAVLTSSTVAFTVCFMIWMMLAVVGIPIKQKLGLNETEFGFLAALPVLSGSLIRVRDY